MNRLTTGTITSPASIAIAPQLIGDCIIVGNELLKKIFAIIRTELNMKHTQHEAFVTRFEYNEYIKGARNEPASAPHETPISCAINVIELLYCISARIDEIAINTTTRILIDKTCFLSLISLIKLSFKKSIVSVELDAITSDESVDIDADKTRITTSAISIGLNPESIVGIIESYPLAATSISSEKRRPNQPRK